MTASPRPPRSHRRPRGPRSLAAAAALLAAAAPLAVVPHASADDDGGRIRTAPATERRVQAVAALERAEDVLDGTAPASEGRSATLALRDLRRLGDALPASQQARAAALLARPVLGAQSCSTTTCVHYSTDASSADAPDLTDASGNGVPDYVDLVLTTVDGVRGNLVAAGYRAPKSDGVDGGGPETDVYLENLGGGANPVYGYCSSDDPNQAVDGIYDMSAYCALDNDFSVAEFGGVPVDSLKVTVAHEYFHAVQFAYDYYEDDWLLESTATWMEDELYDGINDNLQYLSSGPMRYTNVPVDYFEQGSGFQYGTWIFFRRLSERFPAAAGGLPTIVRDIWRRADATAGAPDNYSLQAVSTVLAQRGTSLRKEFALFELANRAPRTYYSEGASYPTAPAKGVVVRSTSRNPSAYVKYLDHLTSSTVRYSPSGLKARNWRLKLVVNMPPASQGSTAVVKTVSRSGATSAKIVTLNSKGDAAFSVPFSSSTVSAVEVTLVNASARFSCWYSAQSPFSCYGLPLDDGRRSYVDPLAYRN